MFVHIYPKLKYTFLMQKPDCFYVWVLWTHKTCKVLNGVPVFSGPEDDFDPENTLRKTLSAISGYNLRLSCGCWGQKPQVLGIWTSAPTRGGCQKSSSVASFCLCQSVGPHFSPIPNILDNNVTKSESNYFGMPGH